MTKGANAFQSFGRVKPLIKSAGSWVAIAPRPLLRPVEKPKTALSVPVPAPTMKLKPKLKPKIGVGVGVGVNKTKDEQMNLVGKRKTITIKKINP